MVTIKYCELKDGRKVAITKDITQSMLYGDDYRVLEFIKNLIHHIIIQK